MTPDVGDDRPHMVIDLSSSSPYLGNIYIAYANLDSNSLEVRRSTDGGATFDSAVVIATGSNRGVNLALDDDGTIYAVWDDATGYGGFADMFFSKSVNGGIEFSTPRSLNDVSGFGGFQGFLKNSKLKSNGHPTVAVDTSGGPFDGRLYVVWGNGNDWPDVHLRWSDNGIDWSSAIRVNTDQSEYKDQWFPWVEVDPYGGVNVVFYDSRNDPNNERAETFLARSVDGGQTFSNVVVSSVSFMPCSIDPWNSGLYCDQCPNCSCPYVVPGWIGDYLAITSDSNFIYPCWPDNRVRHPSDPQTGIYQVFIARFPLLLSGRLIADTTLNGIVVLSGDVTIDTNVTVTLASGATLIAKGFGDTQHGGWDSQKVEIIVRGTLQTSAGGNRPILRGDTESEGSWYGVRIDSGGKFIASGGLEIRNAVVGVTIDSLAESDTIRGVVILNSTTAGFWCESDAVHFVQDTVTNVSSGYGMYLYQCGPRVESCVFDSCEYGIYAFGSLSTIRGCKIEGPGVKGVMIEGIPDPDSGEAPLFKYRTTYLRSTEVKGHFTSSHLGVGYRGSADIDSCTFETNCGDGRSPYGVRSQWESSKVHMRRSKILNYSNTGYYSSKSTSNLGTSPSWGGNNQIYTDTTGSCIKSVRHTGKTSTDTLKAESNWWGTASPPSSWFTSLVDYTPWLTSQPLGKLAPQMAAEPTAVPGNFALEQNYPNPFNPSTVIEFSLPAPSKVEVRVFNILGQVVKELADREFPAGHHQLIWDGTDARGSAAPSGIYFYKTVSEESVESKKMVLLR